MTNQIDSNTLEAITDVTNYAKSLAAGRVRVTGAQGCIYFIIDGSNKADRQAMLDTLYKVADYIHENYNPKASGARQWKRMRRRGYKIWRWTSDYCSWVGGLQCGIRAKLTEEERKQVLLGHIF